MKITSSSLGVIATLVVMAIGQLASQAEEPAWSFYRIVSSSPTRFLEFRSDGTTIWSNAAVGGSGQIETCASLTGKWATIHGFAATQSVMDTALTLVPKGMVIIPGGTNAGTNFVSPGEFYNTDYSSNYNLTISTFYMDRCEVTLAQWNAVKDWGDNEGYDFANVGEGKEPNHPVQRVTWYHCIQWCNARSQNEGREPAYYLDTAFTEVYKTGQVDEVYVKSAAKGYRLPTEAQWEYAARGGLEGRRFPWENSDDIQHARANYNSSAIIGYDTSPTRNFHPAYFDETWPYTAPVGSFEPNEYGLYDMAGNVNEWCFDWGVGAKRVRRGGSYNENAQLARVGNRYYDRPHYADNYCGFRTVLMP